MRKGEGMDLDQIEEGDIAFILESCKDDLGHLKGRSVLITGASGFLAHYLVESWIKRYSKEPEGGRLIVASRRPASLEQTFGGRLDIPAVHFLDSSDPSAWGSAECDYLVHCASPSDPALYLKDPSATMNDMVGSTRTAIEVARRSSAKRILYLSSGAVYGTQPRTLPLVPETFTGGPNLESASSCYAEAKRFCEVLVRTSGVPFVIARGFSFMGPHQDLGSSFAIPDFIRQASTKGSIRIKGDGRAVRSYCYEADAAIILWRLLLRDLAHDVYNIGSDRFVTSIEGLAGRISGLFGVPFFIDGKRQEGLAQRYVPDCSRQREVHDPCIDIEEGLSRTIASMRSRGIIDRCRKPSA
jgi:nucleoside-diphosphate-sugar epimerase